MRIRVGLWTAAAAVLVATPVLADVRPAQNASQLASMHSISGRKLPGTARAMQKVGVQNGIEGDAVALSLLAGGAVIFGGYEATKGDGHGDGDNSSSP